MNDPKIEAAQAEAELDYDPFEPFPMEKVRELVDQASSEYDQHKTECLEGLHRMSLIESAIDKRVQTDYVATSSELCAFARSEINKRMGLLWTHMSLEHVLRWAMREITQLTDAAEESDRMADELTERLRQAERRVAELEAARKS